MKRKFSVFTSAIVIVFILVAAAVAKAQAVREAGAAQLVRFAGAENNYLVFELDASTLQDGSYVLEIQDRDKAVLFSERFQAGASKRYKFEKGDWDQLHFHVSSKKFYRKESFLLSFALEEKITVQPMK